MRNWNSCRAFLILFCWDVFLLYLWGIETLNTYQHHLILGLSFYFTYEELKLLFSPEGRTLFVCFYFTYEELKHVLNQKLQDIFNSFLLYLWGIETCLMGGIDGKIKYVFTLPMRNWNLTVTILEQTYTRFLLYLWGIETPTREHAERRPLRRFYFTYEELKQRIARKTGFMKKQVFTLPMRNWNWIDFKRRVLEIAVFTLPMRNWNKNWAKKKGLNDGFLLYLWGIETYIFFFNMIPIN